MRKIFWVINYHKKIYIIIIIRQFKKNLKSPPNSMKLPHTLEELCMEESRKLVIRSDLFKRLFLESNNIFHFFINIFYCEIIFFFCMTTFFSLLHRKKCAQNTISWKILCSYCNMESVNPFLSFWIRTFAHFRIKMSSGMYQKVTSFDFRTALNKKNIFLNMLNKKITFCIIIWRIF